MVGPMISRDPPGLDALYFAADAYSGLGDLSVRRAQQASQSVQSRAAFWSEARSQYQRSLEAWQRIPHPYHTAPHSFQVGDPALVAKRLKMAEAEVSALH